MPDNCTLVDRFTKVPVRSMWVPRSRAMETGHFHLASMVFAWPAPHEPLLIEGFSCPIGHGMQESPTKPYEHLRVVWGGQSRKILLANARRNRRSIIESDEHGPHESKRGRTRPNDQIDRSIDPNHSTLATESNTDDGQFRSGVWRNENGSSSIKIENFRRFIERKTSIDGSVGQVRRRQDSMGNFDRSNENASSSIEIDRISDAFHQTKESFESNGRVRSSKTNHGGQDKRDRTDNHERIDRTKSMNPTRKRRTESQTTRMDRFWRSMGNFDRANENASSSIEIDRFHRTKENLESASERPIFQDQSRWPRQAGQN